MPKLHAIFDTEIIGLIKPIFLTCIEIVETGERHAFWHDQRGHTKKLTAMLEDPQYTWVGFNSENFDRPLIAMAVMGHDETNIKVVCQNIIEHKMMSWQTYREYDIDFIEYDHIDIKEVPKGVMLSLKVYEGRMHSPNLQDMPFHHDEEIDTPKKRKVVEDYCWNDISETKRLFLTMKEEVELREQLGEQYGVDIRSKSDAQCAEAILKKVCSIGKGDKVVPGSVRYSCPKFIKTNSKLINEIIAMCEDHKFIINFANGSPEFPEFLTEPIDINGGVYQMGIGGLHSKHDKSIHLKADPDSGLLLSDFDVASYYPNIMIKAGLIPNLGGNKGALFLDAYQDIYAQRIAAKRRAGVIKNEIADIKARLKKLSLQERHILEKQLAELQDELATASGNAESLKILLNGTFGKLGSIFCSFYAPALMLAVTITGELNLLCLIYELTNIKGVTVESANTDGIMVSYPLNKRDLVLRRIQLNAKRTQFEYEETPYEQVAIRDVNSYFAVPAPSLAAVIDKTSINSAINKKLDVKRKGAYSKAGVKENTNPTMEVCSDAVSEYLLGNHEIEDWIRAEKDIRKFVEIRGVKGGGIQHQYEVEVDDWVLIKDLGSAKNEWYRQAWLDKGWEPGVQRASTKRKSRPNPAIEGRGGKPFGRVARWYMTKDVLPSITYVESGNQVAGTAGSKLCMTLPDKLPKDLNLQWYIDEAYRILDDCGVKRP